MTKPGKNTDMPDQKEDEVKLQSHLEEELQKVQKTIKTLEDDRKISNEILHETFTL